MKEILTRFWSSKKLRVTTPTRHVLARVGGQAELSCQAIPPQSLMHMEVRWFRSGHSQPVYLYRGGHKTSGEAAPEYANRTEFVKEGLGEGKVMLRIHNISILDDGPYQCSFNDSGFVDVASMNLNVTAVGLETEIHVQDPDADGIMVECNSGGWFPRPQMEWRDSNGETLLHSSKSYSQDEARFFHMKMTLLTNMSQGSIICCVFNPLTGEEKQTSILLASELFNQDHIWMKSLVFIACIMFIVYLLFICCFFMRKGCASGCLRRCLPVLNSWPIQILHFLVCTGVLFAIYLPHRHRVSLSDPRFPLYNNWITELLSVTLFLIVCFVLPIIILLLKQLSPTCLTKWEKNKDSQTGLGKGQ
ncbi:selection and upkeep of intraepithelial T-cells protein 8-like isoform X2 [Mastomys coucha]|uniref:selection and upkeep of intraepithelial T-cells protein 8-like isoform X2 n=1 Tax=Mastomys coucha TaxID=35658 RepID=UPI0012629EAE|nr:selection and upkeep of intraepithelial T-cells protein 8-like isoform X2 [Mastomys coucha]